MLRGTYQAPGQARRFVEQELCPEHATDAAENIMLLTSELVTLSVLDGAPSVSVTLACEESQVRIAVTERRFHPVSRPPLQPELCLLVVDRVSGEWGSDLTGHGRAYWCTVPVGRVVRSIAPAAACS